MRRRAIPFLIGVVSGALGGLMGVGGGLVLVPLLVYVLHQDQHQAQGTSLAFVIVSALVAAGSYYTFQRLDLMLALSLAAGAVPGVILGSRLAAATPGPRLRVAFGVVLLATAIRLIAVPPSGFAGGGTWPTGVNVFLGLAVGVLAGLLGLGGGTMLVPILVLGERIDQHTAQGISLVMIVPVGVVGMLSYARQGKFSARGLPLLLAGGAIGALAGAFLAHQIQAPMLTRLFALFLLLVAVQMIFKQPRDTVAVSAVSGGGTR